MFFSCFICYYFLPLSAEEWIRKLWYIYTMEYYSAIKKNTFESVLMRWMKLEPIIQSDRKGNGTPLWYSCLENPMGGGAWWAAVHGVAKSWTRLSDFPFTFMHWRRKWQPTPVFLPGESQRLGSLVGCCLWGCTELDTTEVT